MRKKIVSAALAACVLMTPVASAQSGSDILWREYTGFAGAGLALFFFGHPAGPLYLQSQESADREKKIKDKEKIKDLPVTLHTYDDWWEMDGLSPEGDLDWLGGDMTTKNDKVYKVTQQGGPGQIGFEEWVEDFIEANGSESADVDEASMKGKFKLSKKDGSVKFKLLIKYLGTNASGDDFGAKAKGKIKFKGVVEDQGPVPE